MRQQLIYRDQATACHLGDELPTHDQAAGLRALMVSPSVAPVIVVSAHESALCHDVLLHVVTAATRAGHRLVMLDGTRRAQFAASLNFKVRYELLHWLEGNKTLAELSHRLPTVALRYLAAYRGLRALSNTTDGMKVVLEALSQLPDAPNFVLLHGGPDLLPSLAQLAARCATKPEDSRAEMIWRVLPRHDVITATYLQLKKVAHDYPYLHHRIWLQGVSDAQSADHIFANLADTAQEFLGVVPDYLGYTLGAQSTNRKTMRDLEVSTQRIAHLLFQPAISTGEPLVA